MWEMQTADGNVRRQYDENGVEHTWKDIDAGQVVRVSFLPRIPGLPLPRHDAFIDITAGERFVKRFGRGFLKDYGGGFKLAEYINCCVTNRYRLWVFSSGQALVTRPDYEVFI